LVKGEAAVINYPFANESDFGLGVGVLAATLGTFRRTGWRDLVASHQGVAAQVLAAADVAGLRNPEAFAAQVLTYASEHGGLDDANVMRTARAAALSDRLVQLETANRALRTDPSDVASQAAADDAHAGIRLLSRKLVDFKSGAPLSAAQTTPARTQAQVLVAYNLPSHWLTRSSGAFAPNPARLVGESASAWARITQKFGPTLAERLFDASTRGGVMQLLAVLDEARSPATLTIRDLSELQGIARTGGAAEGLKLTLHDFGHGASGYGPSAAQEIGGDHFAEFLLSDLFKDKSELQQIPAEFRDALEVNIDLQRPLAQQPKVLAELARLIERQWGTTHTENFRWETQKLLYERLPVEIFMTKLRQDWTGRSSHGNAVELERTLERGGLLAHLGKEARGRIAALIYGAESPSSFESLVRREDPNNKSSAFQNVFVRWVQDTLAPALVRESAAALPSKEVFQSRAADAIAGGLMLERTAPGVLGNTPVGKTLDDAEANAALKNLDLRTAYPAVRAEVRKALGLGL
jgi:hypothetical protein